MQQLVRVQKCNDDGTALVRNLCLNGCQSCAGCKNKQLLKVKNSMGATCGQVVVLVIYRWKKLCIKASCLLPITLLFAGLKFRGSTGGILGFLLGLVVAIWMITKEMDAYTITSLSERPKKKGDNDLD